MSKIDWKFKPDASLSLGMEDFWYCLTDGGYIKPEELLDSEDQIQKVQEAIAVINSFESALEDNGFIEEM